MPDRGDERKRILDMLAAGKITAEQAAELLKAVGPAGHAAANAPFAPDAPSAPRAPAAPPHPRGPARMLRINIDAAGDDESERAKVRVNVPLSLAKFAMKFVPEDARIELEDRGIDIAELLDNIGDELPEGPLVDIDASDGEGRKTAKITVEVV